jgi:hypothetical protein
LLSSSFWKAFKDELISKCSLNSDIQTVRVPSSNTSLCVVYTWNALTDTFWLQMALQSLHMESRWHNASFEARNAERSGIWTMRMSCKEQKMGRKSTALKHIHNRIGGGIPNRSLTVIESTQYTVHNTQGECVLSSITLITRPSSDYGKRTPSRTRRISGVWRVLSERTTFD